MSGDFPVPDLKHLTDVQLDRPPGGWEIAGGTMHDAGMGATQDRLNGCVPLSSKHGGHFAAAIGEGGTKQQEELLETFGTPQDHTRGDVHHFAIGGNIRIGIVKPVWIGLVGVVGIIAALNKSHHFLCRHDKFFSLVEQLRSSIARTILQSRLHWQ